MRVNIKGSYEALLKNLKEAYVLANNENPQVILVNIGENDPDAEKIFDTLNKIFHYYDIPGVFRYNYIQLISINMYSRENLKKHEIYIDYFSLTIDMAALPSI